jgi:hypothetical protein
VQWIDKVFLKHKNMIFNIFLVLWLTYIQAFFAKLTHLSQIISVKIWSKIFKFVDVDKNIKLICNNFLDLLYFSKFSW